MRRAGDALLLAVLALPEEQRAEIAGALLDSLSSDPTGSAEGLENVWLDDPQQHIGWPDDDDPAGVRDEIPDEIWARAAPGRRR